MINHSKIVKNECPHTKNEEKKQINAHSIFKYNQPKTEIPITIYEMGAPSIKLPLKSWLAIIPFNFGSYYQKCFKHMYILKIVLIHEMHGCQYMILKEIRTIFVSMIICSIADHLTITYTSRKRNKFYSVLIQKCFFEI